MTARACKLRCGASEAGRLEALPVRKVELRVAVLPAERSGGDRARKEISAFAAYCVHGLSS